jgi:hypothetical protein
MLKRRKKSEPSTIWNGQKAKDGLLRRTQRHSPIPLSDIIKELFEKARDDVEYNSHTDDKDLLFWERSKATTQFYNVLVDIIKYIEQNYSKELWAKRQYYPRKWMTNNAGIWKALQKGRIIDVLNFLDTNNLNPKNPLTIKLAERNKYPRKIRSGKSKGETRELDYALILVNNEFYEKVKCDLKISKIYMQKHLQQFCSMRILRRLMKVGVDKREWLYADGYYIDWDGKKVKKHFLRNTRIIRQALKDFRIS